MKRRRSSVRNLTAKNGVLDFLVGGLTRKILKFTGSQNFLIIQLDITNACNLRCVHCYHPHHQNQGALDFEGWLGILDQYEALLRKLYLQPAVIFCGGEPLTSPLLSRLLLDLERRFSTLNVCVLTNGTVIRSDLLPLFKRLKARFQVSLDGPDEARHDEIRGKENFKRSLKGIEFFLGNKFEVDLLAVLSKKSATWIPEFFDLAKRVKVTSMNFTRFIPEGTGQKLLLSSLDRPLLPFELKGAFQSILTHSQRTEIPTHTDQALFQLIDPNLGCNNLLGFSGLVVDYRGNVKMSSRSNYLLGNALTEGLEDLFLKHPLMKALREGDVEGCGDCKFYRRCGGYRTAAYAETGSFLAPDPGCWYLEENKHERRQYEAAC
jgi:AdoMet-dependent heme synthase